MTRAPPSFLRRDADRLRRGLLAAAALACSAPALAADAPRLLASKVEAAVLKAYRRTRFAPPTADPTLRRAAEALAVLALEGGAREATDAEAVAKALDAAGAWDPPPRAIVVRASPAARAAEAVGERGDLASMPASHFAAGAASDTASGAVVVLLSERLAELEPFPRRVAAGASEHLSGRLGFPLRDARVFVTRPDGKAVPQRAERPERNLFEVEIAFPEPGRYVVEVVAESVKGPEVAAIFRVVAGSEPRAVEAPRVEPERHDLARAEAQVLAAINERRRKVGAPLLARSASLDGVAADHAAEMVRLGYFAHVSPRSDDLPERLARVGLGFARVAENLGEHTTALEAHRSLEASPGHLANVVDPGVDLVGLGTARVKRGEIDNVILVEVFARAR